MDDKIAASFALPPVLLGDDQRTEARRRLDQLVALGVFDTSWGETAPGLRWMYEVTA